MNRFELAGRLTATSGPRRTPAGLPTLRMQMRHASTQSEAGRVRTVEVETELVAYGEIADTLGGLETGAELRLAGFIDRKGARDPRLELHVTDFALLAPAPPDLTIKE